MEPHFLPLGICTDAFSNTLVCEAKSSFVHVIKEDGHVCVVVSHKSGSTLKTIPSYLSYDVNTHLLWVGSPFENIVSVFRYVH